MKKLSVFRLWCALSAALVVLAAFMPWHGEVQRVQIFLGAEILATDELFGFAFTTILAGIVCLVAAFFIHKSRFWRGLAILAAGLNLIIGAYNYWLFRHTVIWAGLKLTVLASLSGLAAALFFPSASRSAVPPDSLRRDARGT
jgi:hypothetical protein